MYQPYNKDFRDFDIIPFEGRLFAIYITSTHVKDSNQFGLASSTDGAHWTEEGMVMQPSAAGWDSKSLWAMHVAREDDEFIMYYSALGEGWRRHQSMGIARSRNLRDWAREDKPLLYLEPDNPFYSDDIDRIDKWYPDEPTILFRDPWSLHHQSKKYLMFAARDKSISHENNACIGLAELLPDNNVRYLPPLYSPGTYHALECPALYQIDGRWVLLFCDDDIDVMRYATSDGPLSGFSEPTKEPLTPTKNYVGRIVEWDGRHLFYHHTPDHQLSDPKEVQLSERKLILHKI